MRKISSGTTLGIVSGFMLGMLISIVFLPICIAGGIGYDYLKEKQN